MVALHLTLAEKDSLEGVNNDEQCDIINRIPFARKGIVSIPTMYNPFTREHFSTIEELTTFRHKIAYWDSVKDNSGKYDADIRNIAYPDIKDEADINGYPTQLHTAEDNTISYYAANISRHAISRVYEDSRLNCVINVTYAVWESGVSLDHFIVFMQKIIFLGSYLDPLSKLGKIWPFDEVEALLTRPFMKCMGMDSMISGHGKEGETNPNFIYDVNIMTRYPCISSSLCRIHKDTYDGEDPNTYLFAGNASKTEGLGSDIPLTEKVKLIIGKGIGDLVQVLNYAMFYHLESKSCMMSTCDLVVFNTCVLLQVPCTYIGSCRHTKPKGQASSAAAPGEEKVYHMMVFRPGTPLENAQQQILQTISSIDAENKKIIKSVESLKNNPRPLTIAGQKVTCDPAFFEIIETNMRRINDALGTHGTSLTANVRFRNGTLLSQVQDRRIPTGEGTSIPMIQKDVIIEDIKKRFAILSPFANNNGMIGNITVASTRSHLTLNKDESTLLTGLTGDAVAQRKQGFAAIALKYKKSVQQFIKRNRQGGGAIPFVPSFTDSPMWFYEEGQAPRNLQEEIDKGFKRTYDKLLSETKIDTEDPYSKELYNELYQHYLYDCDRNGETDMNPSVARIASYIDSPVDSNMNTSVVRVASYIYSPVESNTIQGAIDRITEIHTELKHDITSFVMKQNANNPMKMNASTALELNASTALDQNSNFMKWARHVAHRYQMGKQKKKDAAANQAYALYRFAPASKRKAVNTPLTHKRNNMRINPLTSPIKYNSPKIKRRRIIHLNSPINYSPPTRKNMRIKYPTRKGKNRRSTHNRKASSHAASHAATPRGAITIRYQHHTLKKRNPHRTHKKRRA